jgi:AcrR family transcriptional regulator
VDRLSAADYFGAALEVLAEHGSEALTIAALGDRLQVTKGSFYHHFGSLPGFVEQLLAYWETEHGDRVIAGPRAEPDAWRRVESLTTVGLRLPHASEAALRAWGRSRPDVAEVVARVDRRRERQLADSIAAVGGDRARARLLARTGLTLLVGAQQREHPVDLRRMRAVLEEFVYLVEVETTWPR